MASTIERKHNTLRQMASRQRHDQYSLNMQNVATVVLSGGQGTRLFPLTMTRCKPAISFGGSFRLIDFALSNALQSGCRKIFVITQFLSSSLHKHICQTYQGASVFNDGFVDLLPAEQTPTSSLWFEGTADAVRKNLLYLSEVAADYYLILSGDQIYQMDFQKMLAFAHERDADALIAAIPATSQDTGRLGILAVNERNEVHDFIEKPSSAEQLAPFALDNATLNILGMDTDDPRRYFGSMGIYLFKRKVLFDLLAADMREDFGKHLLPSLIQKGNVFCYIHDGYWEDVGTISSYYNANMALTFDEPPLNFYEGHMRLIHAPVTLPPAKVRGAEITQSLICDGSLIDEASISHSILGPRSRINKGCRISQSYLLGNDFYTPPQPNSNFPATLQIGEGCVIHRSIIDKDVCLGRGVTLVNKNNLNNYDGDKVYIRDGIIIVSRGACLPDGYTL